MRGRIPIALIGSLLVVSLAGCGGGGSSGASVGDGVPTLTGFCSVAGLPAAVRQTVLVIDEAAVKNAATAELFHVANPSLFALATALSDPNSVQAGTMAARERLTVYVAPHDGGALRLVFTGCVPSLSADDIKLLSSKTSANAQATQTFLGQSPEQKAQDEAETFRTALLGAMVKLSESASGGANYEPIVDRTFTRSLQSVPQLAAPENGVPRLFLFTDVASFAPSDLKDLADARTRGFADAATARLSFGDGEVHIIGLAPAKTDLARQYADAFVLGSEGRLLSWGGAVLSDLPPAPAKLWRFSGKIEYPPNEVPMQMQLATDKDGTLVDSWVIVKTDRSAATPLTGTMTCDTDDNCQITSDQRGFAEVWAKSPGPEWRPEPGLPLGGMRQLTAEFHDGKVVGKVFDPAVNQVGPMPGVSTLDFQLSEEAP